LSRIVYDGIAKWRVTSEATDQLNAQNYRSWRTTWRLFLTAENALKFLREKEFSLAL
jgi:hypothetical protein